MTNMIFQPAVIAAAALLFVALATCRVIDWELLLKNANGRGLRPMMMSFGEQINNSNDHVAPTLERPSSRSLQLVCDDSIDTNKVYHIEARHSGKVLAIDNDSSLPGAFVVQYSAGTSATDSWILSTAGSGGYFYVTTNATNKLLALNVAGAATSDSARIVQWPSQEDDLEKNNDEWCFEDVGDGSGYYWIVARHSSKAIDVDGANTADGASVIQYTKKTSGVMNQQFKLIEAIPTTGSSGCDACVSPTEVQLLVTTLINNATSELQAKLNNVTSEFEAYKTSTEGRIAVLEECKEEFDDRLDALEETSSPSFTPSGSPSLYPTSQPSAIPSSTPSDSPSFDPTIQPSPAPTPPGPPNDSCEGAVYVDLPIPTTNYAWRRSVSGTTQWSNFMLPDADCAALPTSRGVWYRVAANDDPIKAVACTNGFRATVFSGTCSNLGCASPNVGRDGLEFFTDAADFLILVQENGGAGSFQLDIARASTAPGPATVTCDGPFCFNDPDPCPSICTRTVTPGPANNLGYSVCGI